MELLNHLSSWLYAGGLSIKKSRKRKLDDDDTSPYLASYAYVSLYVLADEYEILALRRWCISRLKEVVLGYTKSVLILRANLSTLNSLPDACPLRAWMIEVLAHCRGLSHRKKHLAHMSSEVSFELLLRVAQARDDVVAERPVTRRYQDDICFFHEHESKEERLASESPQSAYKQPES